ncbi:hypothetical protein, partial [Paraburkholderia caribensis]|uniref:hypothetical protein n=1 Tax=Paraburkholderia caribensis TaxID=75105 RepID=UPI001ABB5048
TTAYTQFATWAAVDCLARRAVTRKREAGEAYGEGVGNAGEQVRCRVKDGDVGGPWIRTMAGGVSRFLLPTFLCGGKEK